MRGKGKGRYEVVGQSLKEDKKEWDNAWERKYKNRESDLLAEVKINLRK